MMYPAEGAEECDLASKGPRMSSSIGFGYAIIMVCPTEGSRNARQGDRAKPVTCFSTLTYGKIITARRHGRYFNSRLYRLANQPNFLNERNVIMNYYEKKKAIDNRANQLNPNNIAYYKSRMGNFHKGKKSK